jgi:phage-related protein
MSTNVGSIHYDLKLDTSEFDKKSSQVKSKLNSFGGAISSVGDKIADTGKTMTLGLTLPIVAGAGLAIKAASDLGETINKVTVAFGESSAEVMDFGKTTLKSIGVAKATALDAAALFGDMATSMGLNTKEAAKMSISLVKLAGDLASFKNISFEQAQIALAGIFTGETESLKRLGIVMTEVNLEQFALTQGITKNIREMTQAEKVNLRYAYVMSVTKNAQGDFARTSQSTANQIRYTQERVKELSAEFGEKLLPITGQLLEQLNKLLDVFSKLSPAQQDMAIKGAGLLAALGPMLFIVGKLVSGFGSLVSVVGMLAPVLANPIFLAIVAVLTAIGASVYIIYRNWQLFKPIWEGVVLGFRQFWDLIQPIREFIVNQFVAAWNDIKNAVDRLRQALAPYQAELKILAQLWFVAFIVPFVTIVTVVGFVIGAIGVLLALIARLVGWLVQLGVSITQAMMTFVNWANHTRNTVIAAIINIMLYIASLINAIRNIPGGIATVFRALGGFLYNVGVDAIRGLLQGMINMAGSVYNKAREIANNITNTLKNALRIKSPSQVMANIGLDIGRGVELGMQKSMPDINAMAGSMAAGITAPIGNLAGNANVTEQNTSVANNIYGNISLGDQTAVDRFFDRLNRNGELSAKGMTTI